METRVSKIVNTVQDIY